MGLIEHAKKELELAGMFDKDSDYNGGIGKAVMELVEVFSKQGHSGMSAKRTLQIFNRVADYGILKPITFEEEQWREVNPGVFHHKRLTAVFKDKKDVRPYYIDAIVFQGEDSYDRFTGSIGNIESAQYIKGDSFLPKTFTINVKRELYDKEKHKDINKDDYTVVSCGSGDYVYTFADRKQLEEVFDYYDKK